MNQGSKIAAALCIVVSGIAVAMLFRHESPREDPVAARTSDPLVLRKGVATPASAVESSWQGRPAATIDSAAEGTGAPNGPPTVLAPLPSTAPPELSSAYPSTSRWGRPVDMVRLEAPTMERPARTHKIVDGDTLGVLADRYLGSADRYLEIYEANRDVLPSPQLLPIGAELQIPPRVPSSPNVPPRRPLMPLGR